MFLELSLTLESPVLSSFLLLLNRFATRNVCIKRGSFIYRTNLQDLFPSGSFEEERTGKFSNKRNAGESDRWRVRAPPTLSSSASRLSSTSIVLVKRSRSHPAPLIIIRRIGWNRDNNIPARNYNRGGTYLSLLERISVKDDFLDSRFRRGFFTDGIGFRICPLARKWDLPSSITRDSIKREECLSWMLASCTAYFTYRGIFVFLIEANNVPPLPFFSNFGNYPLSASKESKKHETVTSSSVTMHIWLLTRTIISLRINDRSKKGGKSIITILLQETTFPFSIPFDYSRAKKREKKYNGAYFQLEEAFFAWPVSRIPDSVLRSGSGMQRRRGGSEDRGCTIRWVVVSRVGGLVARPLMRTGLSPVPYSLLHAGTGWWPSSTWLPEIYRAHDARDTVWMYEWTYGSCESCYCSSLIERGRERIRVD